jgi:hypothetical protein
MLAVQRRDKLAGIYLLHIEQASCDCSAKLIFSRFCEIALDGLVNGPAKDCVDFNLDLNAVTAMELWYRIERGLNFFFQARSRVFPRRGK